MSDLGTATKQTVQDAIVAATMAQDSLASIDARVEEIKKHMDEAKSLQVAHEDIKFAVDATEKALSDLDRRRTKRDAQSEEINARLARLAESEKSINALRESNAKMFASLKKRITRTRKQLAE